MRRSGYRDEKERINWVPVSRNWVANAEVAMCLQGLKELHYSFSLYSLVLFFVFLD